MKRAKLAPVLLVCMAQPCCQMRREVVSASGVVYRDGGHLAGDTIVMIEPDGTVILRNKMNKPWADFLQAAVAIFSAHEAGDVATASIARRRARDASAASVARARGRDATDLEKLRIAADLEKFRILNPEQLPALP